MSHNHWSSYWQDGVTHSFGDQAPAWYKSILQPFWQEQFRKLNAHARILDIATGNGSIAFLAENISRQKNRSFIIHAADKAKLKPKSDGSKIHFHAETAIENLKLTEQPFDFISSQFGIEYSNLKRSFCALRPLLKSTGELVIIAHHHDSLICTSSREELKQYRSILDELPVFKKLSLLNKNMGELRSRDDLNKLTSNLKANSSRESFNRLLNRLMQIYPQGIVIADLMRQINPLFKDQMRIPLDQKLAYIQTIENNFRQAHQRLLDMLSATIHPTELKKKIIVAKNCGFTCTQQETVNDSSSRILAWHLRFRRD